MQCDILLMTVSFTPQDGCVRVSWGRITLKVKGHCALRWDGRARRGLVVSKAFPGLTTEQSAAPVPQSLLPDLLTTTTTSMAPPTPAATPRPPHGSSTTVSNVMSSHSRKQRGQTSGKSMTGHFLSQIEQWKRAHRLAIRCCPLVELTVQHSPTHALSAFAFSGVYILIAVGALMMLVGFLGCYGAIQESQCLLGTVSILTSLIHVFETSFFFYIFKIFSCPVQ